MELTHYCCCCCCCRCLAAAVTLVRPRCYYCCCWAVGGRRQNSYSLSFCCGWWWFLHLRKYARGMWGGVGERLVMERGEGVTFYVVGVEVAAVLQEGVKSEDSSISQVKLRCDNSRKRSSAQLRREIERRSRQNLCTRLWAICSVSRGVHVHFYLHRHTPVRSNSHPNSPEIIAEPLLRVLLRFRQALGLPAQF